MHERALGEKKEKNWNLRKYAQQNTLNKCKITEKYEIRRIGETDKISEDYDGVFKKNVEKFCKNDEILNNSITKSR